MIKVPTKITPQYAARLTTMLVLIKLNLRFEILFIIFTLENSIRTVNTRMTIFVK